MRAVSFRVLASFAIVLVSAAPGVAQPAPAPAASQVAADAPVDTAPVTVDGRHLFSVRGIPAFPARERADAIVDRILDLARDRTFDPATLDATVEERGTRIGPSDRLVMILTDADAELEGVDRRLVAEVFVGKIRQAIADYRADRAPQALVSKAWRALLATAIAAVLLLAVRWLIRALLHWLERYHERMHAVTISSFEVVKAERIRAAVRWAVRVLWIALVLIVSFVYLRRVLGFFPWTRGIGTQLGEWMTAPLIVLGRGFLAMLPNLVFLAIFFVLIRWVLRLIRLFFVAAGRGEVQLKGFDSEFAEPTYKLVRLAVLIFAAVVAYPYIPGSSSTAFRGISVFVGIVFSLGSSTAVANVIAGYTMVYRRAFREGDIVKIGDVVGLVTKVRLQVTQIRTPKNEDVVVPNANILNGEVVNYSALAKTEGVILHTTVGIGYQTPWRQVEAMLIEAAGRTPGLRTDRPPFVLQKSLGDFAVTYEINVYCDEARNMFRLYSALHANILDVFNEHGVQIMTPAYEGDPEQPKIVPRENWYLAPATRGQSTAQPESARAAGEPAESANR
jgi:small-conductance mechanosensitive channel